VIPIAVLFEVPLEEFIGARNALAKRLRAEGHEADAKEVAALRKPAKPLWLVNQLARRAPQHLQALIEATGRIRKAQEKGLAGDEVREGMRAQRAALAALTAAAGDAASERRIHDTLQAAAMSEPDALREGRLLQELQPAGFGALLGADVQPLREPPKPHAAKVAEAKVVTAHDPAKAKAAAHAAAAAAAAAKKEAAHAAALEKAAIKAESAAGEAEAAAAKAADAAAKAASLAEAAKEKAVKAREEAKAARAATSRRS
jgi:hypothetical protein